MRLALHCSIAKLPAGCEAAAGVWPSLVGRTPSSASDPPVARLRRSRDGSHPDSFYCASSTYISHPLNNFPSPENVFACPCAMTKSDRAWRVFLTILPQDILGIKNCESILRSSGVRLARGEL